MMMTDEEKRWLVVGIAMNKVAAPVLRDYIKQGMNTHYTNLDTYCGSLTPGCTLKTLTHHQVTADRILKKLIQKFQNVNGNLHLHGKSTSRYNYSIDDSVELAKLYLPDYLAKFSAFDESLDISAILRLLGFRNPKPIFPSPNPYIPIQSSADDVRENVRNKWGHCNLSDWTEAFFNDCFLKLKTLVNSLGLPVGKKTTILDRLSDWQTTGCQLCMGHAVDQQLLSLVQQDVKNLTANYVKTQAELSTLQDEIASLRDEHATAQNQWQKYEEQIGEMKEWTEETKGILEKLQTAEKYFQVEIRMRLQQVETWLPESAEEVQELKSGLCETNVKVDKVQEGLAETDVKVEKLQEGLAETDVKVEKVQEGLAETDLKMEQMQGGLAETDVKVEKVQEGLAKTDVKVEKVQEGLAETDVKVEKVQKGLAETDVKVEKVQEGLVETDVKVDKVQEGLAETDVKVEKVQEGLAETDVKVEKVQEGLAETDVRVEKVQEGLAETDVKVEKVQEGLAETDVKVEKVQEGLAETDVKVEKVQEGLAETDVRVEKVQEGLAETDFKVEKVQEGLAETDVKVEKVQEGLAETDVKVEEVQEGLAETDVKVEEVQEGLAETDVKVEEVQEGLAETDLKTEQLQGGLAETDFKVEKVQESLAETDFKVEKVQEGLAETDFKVEKVQEGLVETDVKVEKVQEGLAETDLKMEQLQGGLAQKDVEMEQLKKELGKTDVKVERLEEEMGETDVKMEKVKIEVTEMGDQVKELELVLRDQRMKPHVVESPSVERFDVNICRSKLAEHYKRTATVPTSVWSKKSPVDMKQIYTRLTWVKEEQTPEGSSKPELNRYTDVFNENENGYALNRILVQGETGIGKTTFVKKMGLDWAELVDERTIDKHQDSGTRYGAESVTQGCEESSRNRMKREESVKVSKDEVNPLKRFELVLAINLKEVSKYSSFRDVVCRSNIFPEEDTAMAEQLISYITHNQEKVLLVFDGYDEYRCGTTSDIYEIFMGNKLRNCCVLITTRISNADDLLGQFKAVHAEITGFSEEDREVFMCKMLGSKTEAVQLEWHLYEEGLFELARVPLLLLFFCTLWKKGKVNSFPETKTKLYKAIVQYVLDHSQGKSSPAHFHEIGKYEDILVEIGKVALECLLKDDHVFEFDQLSASISCEESRFIGLLQVTEFSENLRPAGMVSFIHKSIQEFLAAWYITYRCIPEGDLGDLKECTRSIEDCRVFENVFQFICGLSDDGAHKVFEHMATVRISNSKLDLLKAFSAIERELDWNSYHGINFMYETFMRLLYKSFHEVQSKSKLLNHWFECAGGTVLVTKQLVKFLKETKVNNFTDFSDVSFLMVRSKEEILLEVAQCLDCLDITLRNSETEFTLRDFLVNLKTHQECYFCRYTFVLLSRNRQFQFYVRSLRLCCDLTGRLFTGTAVTSVQSSSEKWWSELRYLHCGGMVNNSTLKALSGVISNCECLESLIIERADGSICDILKSVPNPSRCVLQIGSVRDSQCHLIASEAEKLAALLPKFTNIFRLNLALTWCFAAEVEKLVVSVNHVTLKGLLLNGISLTPSSASVLGQSLPEMSCLEKLVLVGGSNGDVLPVKALFGGFHKTLPLSELWFMDFNIGGCIAPLSDSLRFFPQLRRLKLHSITWNEHNLLHLFRNLEFIPRLETLSLTGTLQSDSEEDVRGCSEEEVMQASFTHQTLNRLCLSNVSLTLAVAKLLGQLIPEMSTLKELRIYERDDIIYERNDRILQDGEVEVLFGGFKERFPLQQLAFHKFSMKGRLDHLINSLQLFPELQWAYVNIDINFIINDANFLVFLERLRNIPCLPRTSIHCKSVARADCKGEGNSGRLQVYSHRLFLLDVSFTPAVASALGRLISEMSTLEEFRFPHSHRNNGENDENTLKGEEIEAIFGHFREVLSLQQLILSGISLTSKAAEALGRCLPRMSSLKALELIGVNGSVLEAEQMNVLFGGFIKELPLCQLIFRHFSMRGCLAPLSNCLRFFPKLEHLTIGEVSLNEHNFFHLLWGIRCIPNLKSLIVEGQRQIPFHAGCSESVEREVSFTLENLQMLSLSGIALNPAVIKALSRLLPKMSSLQVLVLTDGTVLQSEETGALPGGFNESLALHSSTSDDFSVRSVLAPLTDSFRFLPNKARMELDIDLNYSELWGFLTSDFFLSEYFPSLNTLIVECSALAREGCVGEVNAMSHLTLSDFETLELRNVNLTPPVISALRRALSTMSSLEQLILFSSDEIIMQDEEVEVLFGGLDKTINLQQLTFSGFRVGSCLTWLVESFEELPNLRKVDLKISFENENEQNVCSLLRYLRFIPYFRSLSVQCEALVTANTVGRVTAQHFYHEVIFSGVTLTREVAVALGQSLAKMSALRKLKLTGSDGSILNVEEMEALFGEINTKILLQTLCFSGFCVKGVLAPLTKSFQFFPDLQRLMLTALHLDEQDLQGLLENLKFIPELFKLDLSDNPLGRALNSLVPHLVEMLRLRDVNLCQTASEQELNSIQEQVKQARPYVHIRVSRETVGNTVNV